MYQVSLTLCALQQLLLGSVALIWVVCEQLLPTMQNNSSTYLIAMITSVQVLFAAQSFCLFILNLLYKQ